MSEILEKNMDFKFHMIGTGHTLLFISGVGVDRTIWDNIIPNVANNFQIIFFDNKGTGENSKFTSFENTKSMATDVIKLINHLNLKDITVIGHSMGGHVAQFIAAMQPDIIKKLILISSRMRTSLNIMLHYDVLLKLMNLGIPRDILIEDSLSWLYGSNYLKNLSNTRKLINERASVSPLTSIENFINQVKAAMDHDSSEILKNINCETLIINGEDDILCTSKDARLLAKNIRNSTLKILENAGHMVPLENPEELSKMITDFCMLEYD